MTIEDKLLLEFSCAIKAIYGDRTEEKYEGENVSSEDIEAICRKVKFYLDLK